MDKRLLLLLWVIAGAQLRNQEQPEHLPMLLAVLVEYFVWVLCLFLIIFYP